MTAATKAVIEAKPENPGRLTLLGHSDETDLHLQLAPMKPKELFGLANELCARGLKVDLQDTDVEATPAALDPHAALRELGFEPPYPAFDETLDGSAARWDETKKPDSL